MAKNLKEDARNAAQEAKQAAIFNAKRAARRALRESYLSVLYPRIYRQACAEPVDERKVVMFSDKLDSIPDSFSVLHKRLTEEFDLDVRLIALGSARKGFNAYHERCRKAVVELATASVIFLDDASDIISCLPLRPETRIVQLWHACGAFKKWGMSTAELKFGESRRSQLRHPFYRNLSLVTVSSPEVEWAYREAMNLGETPEVVQPVGVSRTDRFFDQGFIDNAREHVRNSYPSIGDRKIILYAPTFRGTVREAQGPDFLDLIALRGALADRYILLVRHHPFVKATPPIPTEARDFAFHAEDLPGDELLATADIMVTDYSSVVFEYSLFDRPMAFLAPDIKEYDDWRGFYYPYEEMTPGPILQNTDDFIEFVNQAEHDTSYAAVIAAFRKRFMRSCDGHATDRILEHTFGERLASLRNQPAAKAAKLETDGIDLSIIVPAYNAMPELTRTLQSIVDQTADHSTIEAIVVDDGSTDGTWSEIQRFATEHPNLFVPVKLDKPSGSPGHPRNVALVRARGTYVLFLDADDWIAPEAVRKMLAHAHEWGSDVLYVKMASEGGRSVPKSMFDRNQPRVEIVGSKILWSIGPTKLFRRSLLEDNGITFLEDGMPEDLHVTVPAICAAKTVSVAADYDYYHCGWREGETPETANTSLGIWRDFESNIRSYKKLMEHITGNWTPKERRDVLMRRIFGLDVMNMVESLVEEPTEEQERRIALIRDIFGSEYVSEVFSKMPVGQRIVLDTLFLGDAAEVAEAWNTHNHALDHAEGHMKGSHILASASPLPSSIDITRAVHAQHQQTEMLITETGILRMAGQMTIASLPLHLFEQGRAEVIVSGSKGRELARITCDARRAEAPQQDDKILIEWSCEHPVKKLIDAAKADDMWDEEPIACTFKPVFHVGDAKLGTLATRQRLTDDETYWKWMQSPTIECSGSLAEPKYGEEGKLILMIWSETPANAKHCPIYGTEPKITYQAGQQPESAPKVSVLTPIYNVERFLPQCIESLQAQTLEDIEFICINDGSTDGSREILERLTKGDPRFVIIDKPNSGYGASMNLGLQTARGEYVGILESDDFADPDCFEALYNLAAANNNPDIVKANHYRLWSDGSEDLCENYPEQICNRILTPDDPEYRNLIASIPAIWAAIYRRDFLNANGIGFLETPGASYQDTGFVMKSWIAADAALIDHAAHLHYRCVNEGSSSASSGKHLCVMDEYASIDEFLAARPARHETLAPAVAAKRLDTYWWNLRRIHPGLRPEFAREAQAELIATDQLGIWENAPLSDTERNRLATWIIDPDRLMLDLAINEARKSKSPKQYPLRLRRKLQNL